MRVLNAWVCQPGKACRSGSKLAGLQTLRAIAALMVLIGHVVAETEHYFAVDLPGDRIPWTRGVDIFFVISGFIIALSAQRFAGQSLAFFWRRFLRVAPLYYLFTTLMVLSLLVIPGATKDTSLDLGQILNSYLFLPYERQDGRIAPVLSLGWTLNYEVFFYALTALCLWFRHPFRGLAALLVLFSLTSLLPDHGTLLTFYTNPLILEFILGVALFHLYQTDWRLASPKLAVVTLALGFLLMIALNFTDLPRFLAAGLPATLIVASGTLFCPAVPLPFQTLGDASFSLYLSHRFTMRLATLALLPLFPASAAWIYAALVCGLCISVAYLVFFRIESPLQRQFSNRTRALA